MTTQIKDNALILQFGTSPSTPDHGEVALYIDNEGIVHQKDDSGADLVLTSALDVEDLVGNSYGINPLVRFPRGTRFDLGSGDVELRVVPRVADRHWFLGVPISPFGGVG